MGLFLVYEQVINYYINKISSGELVEGDTLESEEAVAQLFEVSRGTVRRGLNYLKEKGIIHTKRGRKTVVAPNALQIVRSLDSIVSLTHKRICLMFINDGSYLEPIINALKERIRLLGWGYDVMFNSDEVAEKQCIDKIIERKYDGVICTPYREKGNFELRNYFRLQKEEIPFVLIGQRSEKLFCDAVSNDDYMASYRVTEVLIRAKCSKIIHVTDFKMDKMVRRDRENGYSDAVSYYKKQPTVIDYNDRKFSEKISAILEQRGNKKLGFNIYSDIQVDTLLTALEERGLKAKKDYRIICFKELYDEKVDKRFDTIAVSRKEIGYSALKILKERLDGEKKSTSVTHEIFNCDIRNI